MKLKSQISLSSPEYKENRAFHEKIAETLSKKLEIARQGGGEKNKKHLREQGKLMARERISLLIDEGTEFFELSPLAGFGLYEDEVPAGGIITGIGIISGRTCMVVANDASVKGGTYYPITIKKHLRAQEIAEKNHLPCIYLVDSGGAFLPMQDQVFPDRDHFGRIFFNQARMSAKKIEQISIVHGYCTAGGAYIPAMSDQSVIVKNTGAIFLGGPPLVKAATGEDVSTNELGGAEVHTSISGVSDHFAENDTHAISICREIVAHLGSPKKAPLKLKEPSEPLYDPDELLGIIPISLQKIYDIREVIARIVDGSEFFEFKRNYAVTIVTGFAHICGIPVGILGNNGVLFCESALKAAHFIELCCQQKVPLLFLQNITGFMVGKKYEHQGIAKDGAKMVHAVANAMVPKITVIVGGSFGAGNYGMCGRAYDPSFLFMWPSAQISVMGAEQAANVLATVKQQQLARALKTLSEEEINKIKAPILEKYRIEGSCYYSTSRLWDDGVIDMRETRKVLAKALSSTLYYQWPDTHFGIFRM